ncbi:hypothetical protein PCE1_001083 [Barthelona sp. PCE]
MTLAVFLDPSAYELDNDLAIFEEERNLQINETVGSERDLDDVAKKHEFSPMDRHEVEKIKGTKSLIKQATHYTFWSVEDTRILSPFTHTYFNEIYINVKKFARLLHQFIIENKHDTSSIFGFEHQFSSSQLEDKIRHIHQAIFDRPENPTPMQRDIINFSEYKYPALSPQTATIKASINRNKIDRLGVAVTEISNALTESDTSDRLFYLFFHNHNLIRSSFLQKNVAKEMNTRGIFCNSTNLSKKLLKIFYSLRDYHKFIKKNSFPRPTKYLTNSTIERLNGAEEFIQNALECDEEYKRLTEIMNEIFELDHIKNGLTVKQVARRTLFAVLTPYHAVFRRYCARKNISHVGEFKTIAKQLSKIGIQCSAGIVQGILKEIGDCKRHNGIVKVYLKS